MPRNSRDSPALRSPPRCCGRRPPPCGLSGPRAPLSREGGPVRMTIAVRLIGVVLLVASAAYLHNEANRARVESSAWQQIVTLQFEAAAAGPAENATRLATVDYWLGLYDAVAKRGNGAEDPDVLFAAANAAYRTSRRDHTVGADAARRLDPVIQAYANVLRAAPRHPDAAYNLEYVAWLRDQVVRMQPSSISEPPSGNPTETDLPRGPTVHGLPGSTPPNVKGEKIEVLTPKDIGERESESGQAPGRPVRRKG